MSPTTRNDVTYGVTKIIIIVVSQLPRDIVSRVTYNRDKRDPKRQSDTVYSTCPSPNKRLFGMFGGRRHLRSENLRHKVKVPVRHRERSPMVWRQTTVERKVVSTKGVKQSSVPCKTLGPLFDRHPQCLRSQNLFEVCTKTTTPRTKVCREPREGERGWCHVQYPFSLVRNIHNLITSEVRRSKKKKTKQILNLIKT